jgi:CHAT domain-containing protein
VQKIYRIDRRESIETQIEIAQIGQQHNRRRQFKHVTITDSQLMQPLTNTEVEVLHYTTRGTNLTHQQLTVNGEIETKKKKRARRTRNAN